MLSSDWLTRSILSSDWSGSADKDGRIKVNDQLLEVDGDSLVGVTQAWAATVLRNTEGSVR